MKKLKKNPKGMDPKKRNLKDEESFEMIDEEEEELEESAKMSLVGHLAELRSRIVSCLIVFILAFGVALWQASPLTTRILSRGSQFSFVYISPAELMMNYFRIALIAGLVAAVPMIIYQVWQFLRPGLKRKEKRFFALLMSIGLVLFILGTLFAYHIALPIILDFFARLDTTQTIKPMISVEAYISYFVSTMIIFGVIFECPIVITSLVGVGLVKPSTLQKNFKYVVLVIFTVGAIITPPDVTSQILVSVPLMLLFEISILISRALFGKRIKAEEEEEREWAGDDDEEEE